MTLLLEKHRLLFQQKRERIISYRDLRNILYINLYFIYLAICYLLCYLFCVAALLIVLLNINFFINLLFLQLSFEHLSVFIISFILFGKYK